MSEFLEPDWPEYFCAATEMERLLQVIQLTTLFHKQSLKKKNIN